MNFDVAVDLSYQVEGIVFVSPVIVLKSDDNELPEFLDLIIIRLMKHVDFAVFKMMKRHAVVTM